MSKVEHLRKVPIFSDLSDSDLEKISSKMISRIYEKGKMILLEESEGETFFIILSGVVKVTRLSDDGREVILAILGESDFFGEMSLLDGEGRSANIVANEKSEVVTLSRRDFLDCLQKYPKIAIALLEELAVRLRKSDQHIESLSLSDSEQRIGITLIRLAEELGTIKQGDVNVKNLPFQQVDLQEKQLLLMVAVQQEEVLTANLVSMIIQIMVVSVVILHGMSLVLTVLL